MHRFLSEGNLFPEAVLADEAIETVRSAVNAMYQHVRRPTPAWVQDDHDRGWDRGGRGGASATLIHAGVSEDDPEVVKICYVHNDEEQTSDVLPSGTDYDPYVEDLIRNVRVPISAVKVYKGATLVHERKINMRGT